MSETTEIIAMRSPSVVLNGTITLSASNPLLNVKLPRIKAMTIERVVVTIPIRQQVITNVTMVTEEGIENLKNVAIVNATIPRTELRKMQTPIRIEGDKRYISILPDLVESEPK